MNNTEIKVSPKNKTLKSSKLALTVSKTNRCKNGTQKFIPLGPNCYTQEEINNYKLTKSNNKINYKSKTKKSKTKTIEFIIKDESPEIIEKLEVKETKIEPKMVEIAETKLKKKVLTKRRLKIKTPVVLEIMEEENVNGPKRYNEEFIELMEKLNTIMLKHGEPFRARAYQKAQETIMGYPDDITDISQLKGQPGIGPTIMEKLDEYVKTGTLRVLEREKTNPINILADVYGIGPKKAQELVNSGVKTIEELRERQNELLNDIQKVGLKYHDDIQQRIPRQEIEEYYRIFKSIFEKISKGSSEAKFEIVGSYRRGAQTSGDIDIIITGKTGEVYKNFIDELLKTGIILEILSRGQSKTLVIAKLPGENIARRIDFLYTPPDEYPFAILYFTGSKIFNTVMRQYALNKGYTFNEHGIYQIENKKKGLKVNKQFTNEKDIIDFLGLQFKSPIERKDGRAVVAYTDVGDKEPDNLEGVQGNQGTIGTIKKNKTVKKRNPKPELVIEETEPITLVPNTDTKDKEILFIIENFKKNGITVLEDLSENQLNTILHNSNSKYYNDEPIMSDNQYDIVKEYIEHKYPSNKVVNEIGAEVERNKAKLPYEMGSMDKIKPDTGALTSWIQKYKGPYVISCKLDGVSGLYTTEGTSAKLYTRGNGKIGQDISHLIPYLRLPKTKGIVIRGEFIIPKSIFDEKYKSTFANPRNMVAGIINHKTINKSIGDLHFVAYEVIKPQQIPSKQMEFLKTINIESVLYKVVDSLSNDMLSAILIDWRKNYLYEIDGIIVTDDNIYPRKSGNPEHAFAFKMILSDQIAEAKVVDVIWTPSKDGYLKPRVRIEPINLGGVTIEYATGFNAAFINDNKIGIGSTIEIIRSGDVIPHIKSVTIPAEQPKMPSVPYKWNDTHVDIILENASEDLTVKEKNITGFFKGIQVEGLSSGNINRLVQAGFTTVPQIIHMKEQDFLKVDGFKEKMASKIYKGIQDKLKETSVIQLMAASNIFGRGFSDKKMELIINELPDIIISEESNSDKIKQVSQIKGMALKTAEAFVDKINDFKEFMNECGLEYKLYEKPAENLVDKSHPFYGKSIVLTGTRDKNILDFLKKVGANQGSSISKNTFLVIAKNKDEDTGKAEEARKLNIPIVSVEEFTQTFL